MTIFCQEKTQPRAPIYFAAGILAAFGTGGTPSLQLIGYTSPNVRISSSDQKKTAAHAMELELIRNKLKISVSALSRVFGVSRQAYYNWIEGQPPSDTHRARISDLYQAALILEDISWPKELTLAEPIIDGRNFWQLVSAGSQACAVANKLRQTMIRTQGQRERAQEALAKQLQSGTAAPFSIEDFN